MDEASTSISAVEKSCGGVPAFAFAYASRSNARCPLRVPAGLRGQLHAATLLDGPQAVVDPFDQAVCGHVSVRLLLGTAPQLARSQRLLDAVLLIQRRCRPRGRDAL